LLNERIPDKIVVFYDKESEAFLIRLVDRNWIDIFKYDTLPALCKLSNFYVDIIKVEDYEVIHHMVEEEVVLVNNLYRFSVHADGVVRVKTKEGHPTTMGSLKRLFGVAI
jgi:hypothetical protein